MKRVLVIRFSSLGDIILTEPVVAAFHGKDRDHTVDYLVLDRFRSLVEHFADRPDEIIPFPETITARQLPSYARDLAHRDYDLVVDLHDSLRSKVLRRAFDQSRLRVYRKPRLNRWLLFYLNINRFSKDFAVVEEYLRFAGAGAMESAAPRMQVPPDKVQAVRERLNLPADYLVCIPGAAWPQKSWFSARYGELFNDRLAAAGVPLVLLGGPNDTVCDEIASAVHTMNVVNLKGQTSLEDALAVLAGCRFAMGADTGLAHAAEALNKRVVMIFGPTSRETGARCHNPGSRLHEVDIWCRPCSQNGRRRCYRREQFCLTGISVDEVGKSINHLLGMA